MLPGSRGKETFSIRFYFNNELNISSARVLTFRYDSKEERDTNWDKLLNGISNGDSLFLSKEEDVFVNMKQILFAEKITELLNF